MMATDTVMRLTPILKLAHTSGVAPDAVDEATGGHAHKVAALAVAVQGNVLSGQSLPPPSSAEGAWHFRCASVSRCSKPRGDNDLGGERIPATPVVFVPGTS